MGKRAKIILLSPFITLIHLYKLVISPWLPPACRFTPTCSEYAEEALKTHGIFYGSWLAFYRILRCQPFSKGGYDPVPKKNDKVNL